MTRLVALASLLALGAVGCAPEDPQQRAAREATQRYVRDDPAYTGEAHCTDSARTGWFAKRFTEAFVCAAHRDGGGCDWLTVRFDVKTRRVTVQLEQRDAGCTLPV